MLNKIGVIGGGNIGGVLIQEIARRRLARQVGLMDVLEPDFAKGKCLDIAEGTPIVGIDVDLDGARDYSAIKGALNDEASSTAAASTSSLRSGPLTANTTLSTCRTAGSVTLHPPALHRPA